MKKAKIGIFILTIVALIVISGCPTNTTSQKTLSESEKATIVSEAVTDSYSTLNTTSKDYNYTATSSGTGETTVSDGSNGTLTVTLGTDTSGLADSQYYNDIQNATFVYQFTYNNFHLTVTDEDGNDIPVVLNGSINCAFSVNIDTTTGDQTIIIVFFGNVNGTVNNENFSSYSVDIKYTYTGTGTTASGKIEGTANGETINETYTVEISAPST